LGLWRCLRHPVTPGTAAVPHSGAITISHEVTAFAIGSRLNAHRGLIQFLVTEERPLVPGQYCLTEEWGTGPHELTIRLR